MMNRENSHRYFIHLFFLGLMSIMQGACVDLTGSDFKEKRLSQTEAKTVKQKKNDLKGEVYTMRGCLGIFSTGMNQLKDSVAKEYNIPASSSMWYRSGEVSKRIARRYSKEKNHKPLILIGHSLGANEQIMVARYLAKRNIPVDLLVTVDSVCVTNVPANVREVLNIYKPGFVPMFSGLRLKAVNPNTTRLSNVNVNDLEGVRVNHFTIDSHQVVQNMILDKVEKVLSNAVKREV